MAVTHEVLVWPGIAGADLTTKQFTLVRLDATSGQMVPCVAGEQGFVLQDAPSRGQEGSYALLGVTKAITGGTVRPMQPLTSDANGNIVAATDGDFINAIALHGGASGDLVSIHVTTGASVPEAAA